MKSFLIQRSRGHLLRDYIYELDYWRRSGDDGLSAEDAMNTAKSLMEEMIIVAKQVNFFATNVKENVFFHENIA